MKRSELHTLGKKKKLLSEKHNILTINIIIFLESKRKGKKMILAKETIKIENIHGKWLIFEERTNYKKKEIIVKHVKRRGNMCLIVDSRRA